MIIEGEGKGNFLVESRMVIYRYIKSLYIIMMNFTLLKKLNLTYVWIRKKI